jgi:hypothetical protein
MKKIFSFLFLLSLIYLHSGCVGKMNPTPDAVLKLRFVPIYDGQALFMDKKLTFDGKTPVKIQRFSLFTQLFDDTQIVTEPLMVDFSNIYDLAAAQNGIVKEIQIPATTIAKLKLGVGINKTDNKKEPKDFKSASPLSEVSEYWDAWKSYIFTKTEGKVDTDGSGKYDKSFSYHTGIDEMYRTIDFAKSINVEAGKTTELIFEIDVNKILNGNGGKFDLVKDSEVHSLSNKYLAAILMNNYTAAIQLKNQ